MTQTIKVTVKVIVWVLVFASLIVALRVEHEQKGTEPCRKHCHWDRN